MQAKLFFIAVVFLLIVLPRSGHAEDDLPRPIPLTRPEMKEWLEGVKTRTPRIPLPELTESDRTALGDQAESYESRLRYHYLNQGPTQRLSSGSFGGRGREQDPNMTLDYGFKVELFWIVSRTNNCHYCLGHQESKLLAAGREEDRIAQLDGDWTSFTAAERTAYEFARKLTYQPYLIGDEDIRLLETHYSDLQIIEMIISLAWNNSINRWKEAVGVPQNAEEGGYSRMSLAVDSESRSPADIASLPRGSYRTPTSSNYASQITRVAPVTDLATSSDSTSPARCLRPKLESREDVEKELLACRSRAARLPLASIDVTRSVFSLSSEEVPPNWLRLLAHFPIEGKRRGDAIRDAFNDEQLSQELKAQIEWIVSRQDRAWYVLAHAREKLLSLGFTEDAIYSLDSDWLGYSERERALFHLARQLAASPVVLSDQDVAKCLGQAGPTEVVRTIQYVTQLSALNRLTEAAGLALE